MRNAYGLKDSIDQYRNIGGVHFRCWCIDTTPGVYEEEKRRARTLGLKYRVIDGQFYREVRAGRP